jgi:TonB family protein
MPGRAAVVAAGLSVALHAALWVAWKPSAPSKPTGVAVEVIRLVPTSRAQPAPLAQSSGAPTSKVPAAVEADRFRSPRAEARAASPQRPAQVDSPASTAPPGVDRTSAQAEPSTSSFAEVNGGSAGSEADASAQRPLDTSILSGRLQRAALRCYPAAARRFHQTGQAQIRFCLDGSGELSDSSVIVTSGSPLLDTAARDCVIPGAAPFGPEAFSQCFTVPVRFRP